MDQSPLEPPEEKIYGSKYLMGCHTEGGAGILSIALEPVGGNCRKADFGYAYPTGKLAEGSWEAAMGWATSVMTLMLPAVPRSWKAMLAWVFGWWSGGEGNQGMLGECWSPFISPKCPRNSFPQYAPHFYICSGASIVNSNPIAVNARIKGKN